MGRYCQGAFFVGYFITREMSRVARRRRRAVKPRAGARSRSRSRSPARRRRRAVKRVIESDDDTDLEFKPEIETEIEPETKIQLSRPDPDPAVLVYEPPMAFVLTTIVTSDIAIYAPTRAPRVLVLHLPNCEYAKETVAWLRELVNTNELPGVVVAVVHIQQLLQWAPSNDEAAVLHDYLFKDFCEKPGTPAVFVFRPDTLFNGANDFWAGSCQSKAQLQSRILKGVLE